MANDVSMKISLDGISEIQSKLNDVGKSFQSFGDKLGEIGRTLTISLTAPLAAFGLAAIKMFAAMGQGKDALQRIIWSLTQMGARGRLTGEELRELAHVGVNAAQIIANAM